MSNHNDEEERHLTTLDEIEATQSQISSYQGLLKDVPKIFEHKFNERLKPLLDRNQQLREERAHLLHQLHQTLPLAAESPNVLLSPASPPSQKNRAPVSLVVKGRLLWLLGLTAAGIALGMHMSKSLVPAPQNPSRPSRPSRLGSLRQQPFPLFAQALQPSGKPSAHVSSR
ncbi:MAG: hypothetical protein RLZZ609_2576 [Cyanobacteriota bacterium]|jgi:hypothetical protein